jgi:ornithine cyclodeaminase
MRILSAADVRQAVPMLAAINAVEQGFIRLAQGNATVPLRTHLRVSEHNADSFYMPAYVGGADPALGLKVVSVFPHNLERYGAPSIHAIVMLLDPATGKPAAILDGTYLTALRTGAASGVATRHMAREDARGLAIIGAGAQALPQVLAVCAVRPIEAIWISNRNQERATTLASRLEHEGVRAEVHLASSVEQALAEADVICCATSSPDPLFEDRMLKPGTHINGVGSYKPTLAEVPPTTVARARLVVDQRAAAWAEAGDLVQARDNGFITEAHVVAELGQVASGAIKGRDDSEQITFFKSVGNAVQDLAVASLALARSAELGLGAEITL